MTGKRTLVCIAVALSAAFPACDNDDGRPASAVTSPGPRFSPATDRCPNAADLADGGTPLGGEISADVTGDGTDDVVYLVRDEAGAVGCRDFLVVEAGSGTLAVPLTDPGREPSLAQPRLHSLAPVDAEPGAEILVDLERGASTQFLGMFTLHDGNMVRVRFERDGGIRDLFPYGGSVGHIEASDCGDEEATVVVSVATPLRDRYEVERTGYRFEGPTLVADRSASERVVVAPDRIQTLQEFRSSPFGSCSVS